MLTSLADHHGLLLRGRVLDAGFTDDAITRAIRRGDLVRIRHGAYALAEVWSVLTPIERHLLRARAVRLRYGPHIALSHVSAHLLRGGSSWQLPLDDVHITHLDGRIGRRQAGVVHHGGCCRVGDVTRDELGWITTPARTALEVASRLPRDPAVALIDWYLRQGLASHEELKAVFDSMTTWPGTLALQVSLRLADGLAESVAETLFRLLCHDAQLPRPTAQFEVRDGRRFVARVDFAWPQHKVIVEIDGEEKYHRFRRPGESIEAMVVREKRREDDVREVTGWIVIRLTWADLQNPARTVARLRRALAKAA